MTAFATQIGHWDVIIRGDNDRTDSGSARIQSRIGNAMALGTVGVLRLQIGMNCSDSRRRTEGVVTRTACGSAVVRNMVRRFRNGTKVHKTAMAL